MRIRIWCEEGLFRRSSEDKVASREEVYDFLISRFPGKQLEWCPFRVTSLTKSREAMKESFDPFVLSSPDCVCKILQLNPQESTHLSDIRWPSQWESHRTGYSLALTSAPCLTSSCMMARVHRERHREAQPHRSHPFHSAARDGRQKPFSLLRGSALSLPQLISIVRS